MHLSIKHPTIVVLIFVELSSCGQTVTSDKQQVPYKLTNKEALVVYQTMTTEICNCTSITMKNTKPSTTLDSCYKVMLAKFTDTLITLGYDPSTSSGQLRLSNEIRLYQCKDLYSLMQKEWSGEDAKKLLFKGELISQMKLPSGLYEIIMKEYNSAEKKTFFAKNPLDETQIKKYEPGYWLTVEYEVVRNEKTNKDEFYLKEGGKTISIGAVKIENQK